MRIETIDIYHVALPLITPWRTAYGDDTAVESVLVRVTSGGAVGWGESTPLAAPCYSPEWAGGLFTTVRDWLAPAVIGQDITSGERLQEKLALFKGNPFAKAALDTAWWVLHAQMLGQPLHHLLGARRSSVSVGADFGVTDSVDELVTAVGQAVDARFPRVKLKYRPGWDESMVRAVRQAFPKLVMHIDCNSGYRLDDAPMFERLDACELAMIEQPLSHDDVIDHAKLQRAIRTPVCLDESLRSVAVAKHAIELGSCRWFNIKPGRVGGITPALQIADLAQRAGIGCWAGSMLESSIGTRIVAALAMLDHFTYPADLFPTNKLYHEDITGQNLELVKSASGQPSFELSDEPGIGIGPDEKRLRAVTKQHARLVV